MQEMRKLGGNILLSKIRVNRMSVIGKIAYLHMISCVRRTLHISGFLS